MGHYTTSYLLSVSVLMTNSAHYGLPPHIMQWQALSYVQARGGSLNIFETQINVMRNCKKEKKYGRKSRRNLMLLLCTYVPPLCCNL